MSRYAPPDYRNGARDRSRSPPRFGDRRPSAAFAGRSLDPGRTGADAPRGPRSQFDAPRGPPPGGFSSGPVARGGFAPRNEIRELRDAPPLGSGRPFRDRDFDRRERTPPPRERSPPRNFRDAPRDFPPHGLDIDRARRGSRDGPPSAGSTYSDPPPFASAPFERGGGFARGRGRGGYEYRGRGGRRQLDDRDLFRPRDRSPPPRWGREPSRDGRDLDRRDDRRFERREEDRRPDWVERERELDRFRREPPAVRLDSQHVSDTPSNTIASYEPPAASNIHPDRLAALENAREEPPSVRRPSTTSTQSNREPRRDPPETPAYLNGRAEATNNRYGPRASSPPAPAPQVPAFGSISFKPTVYNGPPSNVWKAPQELKSIQQASEPASDSTWRPNEDQKSKLPATEPPQAPQAPKVPPIAPKAELSSPPPAAPKAPRALENSVPKSAPAVPSGRLQGVRSWENLGASASSGVPKSEGTFARQEPMSSTIRQLPASNSQSSLPSLNTPVSPDPAQSARYGELIPPTGPKASRNLQEDKQRSPRPPFLSPRMERQNDQQKLGAQRAQTPPPSAPSGPRAGRSFSVSPKVPNPNIPTAPKGTRGPPLAPRAAERGPPTGFGAPDRASSLQPWAPPAAPRAAQWNQWKRPGAPSYGEKVVPAKRDYLGEEKDPVGERFRSRASAEPPFSRSQTIERPKDEPITQRELEAFEYLTGRTERMDVDSVQTSEKSKPEPSRPLASALAPPQQHSAKQSFVGQPLEPEESEDYDARSIAGLDQDSDDDSSPNDMDLDEEDFALNEAKFERRKKEIESQFVDLSARDYRATTPLEQIARLARISAKDLPSPNKIRPVVEDEQPAANHQLHRRQLHGLSQEARVDLLTPKAEESNGVASGSDSIESVLPIRKASPEIISLPYLIKGDPAAFGDSDSFQESLKRQENSKPAIIAALRHQNAEDDALQQQLGEEFLELVHTWILESEDLDREREEQEKLERQQSLEPGPELEINAMLTATAIMEGRRSHKFNSEYEFELVLKQSEETARIEQEKLDRDAKKAQADMEKEARVPEQQNGALAKRRIFVDKNRYRDASTLTAKFAYEPPVDTFSDYEQRVFTQAFKETPKKWGEIASLLPGRSYRDCIHHYYAFKWDNRFRDYKYKRGKGFSKRGRGGKTLRGKGSALMADLARQEDLTPAVNDNGRPKRAAAPTTFGEREVEAKASLLGPSPAKKLAAGPRQDISGEPGTDKPVKRRKQAGGERGGRKGNKSQPLAALAAAPVVSPLKTDKGVHRMHDGKDDVARAQSLADASLLAGLSGHHGMHAEGQLSYTQEDYVHTMPMSDDTERARQAVAPSSKTSASSYWSVPEQNDFVKYIAHFGTDFAAIAAHMGTKTQTMVKNHYQRHIDSGSRQDLADAATVANARRERGEDMGQPPTPTPIVKRRYDNPPQAAQRTLAPSTDAMDVDEPVPVALTQTSKHTSPPQYQPQPRFTTSAQSTPIPAQRVAPGPPSVTGQPAAPIQSTVATVQSQQQGHGPRMGIFKDTRPEPRPSSLSVASFRTNQASQRPQPDFATTPMPDPDYVRRLVDEQRRAIALEREGEQERMTPYLQQCASQHQAMAQRSPALQVSSVAQDRKPLVEERTSTPSQSSLSMSRPAAGQAGGRSSIGSPAFGPLSANPLSFASRSAFDMSSPKKEEPRPSSVPVPTSALQPPVPAQPAEPPKRSNLASILNSEAEEPKPRKRFSDHGVPASARASSPAPQGMTSASLSSMQSVQQSRREMFGQPSVPQSQFQRPSVVQQNSASGPPPPTLKHEPSIDRGPMQHPPRPDWTSRVFSGSQSSAPTPQPPTERGTRDFPPHRAFAFGAMNTQPRANPSPPPHPLMTHSRTPSYTSQSAAQPLREQRTMQQQQPTQSQAEPTRNLQPNPYAPSAPPASHAQQLSHQQQNQAHHSHNSSIDARFPPLHQRQMSREDAFDRQRRQQEEQAFFAQRDREQQDIMRMREAQEADRQMEARFLAQRQQEERQHFRGQPPPPQPLHAPHFGDPRPSLSLREMAARETESRLREEQMMQQEAERRRQDAMLRERERIDEERRRQHEDSLRGFNRTPLGNGGYGPPAYRR